MIGYFFRSNQFDCANNILIDWSIDVLASRSQWIIYQRSHAFSYHHFSQKRGMCICIQLVLSQEEYFHSDLNNIQFICMLGMLVAEVIY